MTHVTCRLTAKNRDQLWNPTLCNRVWATFTFLPFTLAWCKDDDCVVECADGWKAEPRVWRSVGAGGYKGRRGTNGRLQTEERSRLHRPRSSPHEHRQGEMAADPDERKGPLFLCRYIFSKWRFDFFALLTRLNLSVVSCNLFSGLVL